MPPANSQQHTWNRGNLLCGRWCKSLIKDVVVKKAFSSYFFSVTALNTLIKLAKLHFLSRLNCQVKSAASGNQPTSSPAQSLDQVKWYFFAQAAFDNLSKHNTAFYSSQCPPTSSQLAQTMPWREGVAMRCDRFVKCKRSFLPNMAFKKPLLCAYLRLSCFQFTHFLSGEFAQKRLLCTKRW